MSVTLYHRHRESQKPRRQPRFATQFYGPPEELRCFSKWRCEMCCSMPFLPECNEASEASQSPGMTYALMVLRIQLF